MDVTIEQSCPSCGASIAIHEDDRLIRCSYCDVYNYKTGSIGFRYVLPVKLPELIGSDSIIYMPYLRFKGSIYYVRNKEIQYKIVDTTRLGLENQHLPVSLGLRPQVMKTTPVVSTIRGNFILQSVPTKTIFAHAAMIIDLFNDQYDNITYHKTYIGETLSRIYQPCYMQDEKLCDAVTNEVLGPVSGLKPSLVKTCVSKVSWEPRFITTLCPGCGGLLKGERDSLVLQCSNCASLWQEKKGKFVPVEWLVVDSDEPGARFLPFWQINFFASGYVLKTFGDYLRFTNQPLVIRQKDETRPLAFWIPAFKINPKAFLQLASQLTVAQARIPEGKKKKVTNGYPVTLAEKEAVQAIKIVLANTTLSKEKKFPILPELKLAVTACTLSYVPFIVQTHDLIQEHTLAVVQAAALRYGRAL